VCYSVHCIQCVHIIIAFEFCIRRWLFINGKLAPHYDWFHCVVNIPEDAVRVGEPHEGEQMTTLTSGKIGGNKNRFCCQFIYAPVALQVRWGRSTAPPWPPAWSAKTRGTAESTRHWTSMTTNHLPLPRFRGKPASWERCTSRGTNRRPPGFE